MLAIVPRICQLGRGPASLTLKPTVYPIDQPSLRLQAPGGGGKQHFQLRLGTLVMGDGCDTHAWVLFPLSCLSGHQLFFI